MTQQFASFVPTTLDLHVYAGDGFSIRFEFTTYIDEDPFPLDGTWLAQVRPYPLSDDVVAEFDVDISELDAGVVTISMTVDQARTVVGQHLFYDLEQTPVDAPPKTWYLGNFYASSDRSRASLS